MFCAAGESFKCFVMLMPRRVLVLLQVIALIVVLFVYSFIYAVCDPFYTQKLCSSLALCKILAL